MEEREKLIGEITRLLSAAPIMCLRCVLTLLCEWLRKKD